MARETSRIDINDLSDFQKEIHWLPVKRDKDGSALRADNSEKNYIFINNPDGPRIYSPFIRDFKLYTYMVTTPVKFPSKEDNKDDSTTTVTYDLSVQFDVIGYIYMIAILPALRVKEEWINSVQICWPHNPGFNIIESAIILYGDQPCQNLDRHSFAIRKQYFLKEDIEHHNQDVGNVDYLQNWTDFLPEYPLNVDMPFPIFDDIAIGIPLYLCDLMKAKLECKFRIKIESLIRMRVKSTDGEWQELENPDLEYIEGYESNKSIRIPEMWGDCLLMTPDELKRRRDPTQCQEDRTFYYNDFVACNSQNPLGYGEKDIINLNYETPCRGIFFVAENMKATKFHNFSNYTTNSSNFKQGYIPISWVQLKYGTRDKLPPMPITHFVSSEPRKHTPRTPWEPGYAMKAIAWDLSSLDADSGVVFNSVRSATIIFNLADTNPFLKKIREARRPRMIKHDNKEKNAEGSKDGDVRLRKEIKSEEDNEFIIHVRMLVMHKLTFVYDEDKDKKGFKVLFDSIQQF